jgi:hypothetical protein
MTLIGWSVGVSEGVTLFTTTTRSTHTNTGIYLYTFNTHSLFPHTQYSKQVPTLHAHVHILTMSCHIDGADDFSYGYI